VKETVIVRAYFLEYFLFFLDEKPYSKAETALVCVSHKASTVNQIKASHLSKCICIGPDSSTIRKYLSTNPCMNIKNLFDF
jgi:hypothetical protein